MRQVLYLAARVTIERRIFATHWRGIPLASRSKKEGSALPALKALVTQYVGLEFGWGLELELQPGQRPEMRLGRNSRLGWTSWIGQRRGERKLHVILNPELSQAPH